jgi:hypothetical protein
MTMSVYAAMQQEVVMPPPVEPKKAPERVHFLPARRIATGPTSAVGWRR